eukprot:scaffold3096_cov403-Prasinococcus_capsulatus_cf.AAC.17
MASTDAAKDAKSLSEEVVAFLETHHIDKEKREALGEQFIQNDITHPVFLGMTATTLEELLLSQLGPVVAPARRCPTGPSGTSWLQVASFGLRHAVLKLQHQLVTADRVARGEPEEKPDRSQHIPSHRKRLDGKKERSYQKWTPVEVAHILEPCSLRTTGAHYAFVDALEAGVKKYGGNKWAAILKDEEFSMILKCRSQGDLSDKWRGMQKDKSGVKRKANGKPKDAVTENGADDKEAEADAPPEKGAK